VSDNPLAGLRVPSASELADEAVELLGIGTVDLSNKLWRERLRAVLEHVIGHAMGTVEAALLSSQEKAVRHVFRLMEDPTYQDRRAARRKVAKERRIERMKKQAEDLAAARMEHQKKKLEVVKTPTQVIQ